MTAVDVGESPLLLLLLLKAAAGDEHSLLRTPWKALSSSSKARQQVTIGRRGEVVAMVSFT